MVDVKMYLILQGLCQRLLLAFVIMNISAFTSRSTPSLNQIGRRKSLAIITRKTKQCKCEFYAGNNHAQLSHCVGKVVALPIFKLENQSSNPGNMTKRNHMNAQKGKYHSYKMLLEEMTSSQRLKKSGSSVFPV